MASMFFFGVASQAVMAINRAYGSGWLVSFYLVWKRLGLEENPACISLAVVDAGCVTMRMPCCCHCWNFFFVCVCVCICVVYILYLSVVVFRVFRVRVGFLLWHEALFFFVVFVVETDAVCFFFLSLS